MQISARHNDHRMVLQIELNPTREGTKPSSTRMCSFSACPLGEEAHKGMGEATVRWAFCSYEEDF